MGAVVSQQPIIWWIGGYPFLAGPMVVAVFGVAITRLVIGLQAEGKAQWALDLAITALCVFATVLWVQAHQLDLLKAGITGIGIGAAGASIIGFAKSAVMGRAKEAFNAFMGTGTKP